jgi:hypothetical protein
MAREHLPEADLATESSCEIVFAFVVFQTKAGCTAQAARRLSLGPLDRTRRIVDNTLRVVTWNRRRCGARRPTA